MDLSERYIVGEPDPDTLPEPMFANLTWEQIKDRLTEIEYDQWQAEMWYRDNEGLW